MKTPKDVSKAARRRALANAPWDSPLNTSALVAALEAMLNDPYLLEHMTAGQIMDAERALGKKR